MSEEIIIGIHSIVAALNNPKRKNIELIATEDGLKSLRSHRDLKTEILKKITISQVNPHVFQSKSQALFKSQDFEYKRIASGVLLRTEAFEPLNFREVYEDIESGKIKKILVLDQVTDVHNSAAIMRTASFFGIDLMVVSNKSSTKLSPSFYRIASGSSESVMFLNHPSLVKFITKIKSLNIKCIGFSEHASDVEISDKSDLRCLVLGAEDKGLSYAVQRLLDKTICLKSSGEVKSLNVSVAAAIAIERYFCP